MTLFSLFSAQLFLLTAALDVPSGDLDPVRITELFNDFADEFGKVYPTPSDQMNAYSAFSANLLKIQELRKEFDGRELEFGINQYSDLSDAEFAQKVSNLEPSYQRESLEKSKKIGSIPSFLDWRTRKNTVGKVRNQGISGCGWAFAVASALQSAYSLRFIELLHPSEHSLCACSQAKSLEEGLRWVNESGVALEDTWNGTCSNWENKISPYTFFPVFPNSEHGIQRALVENGPIIASFRVGLAFRHYKSGVFNSTDCRNTGTSIGWHAATVVGYGSSFGKPYWTVKNSWGEHFGENGYVRFARGESLCDIETAPAFVTEM
ncbi:unnamed protein product [Caenorhabditis sp. 36 PRJEB53466]|nr:unnamed protein product [Caenorhabditis sp. 36 PRJEB53466]